MSACTIAWCTDPHLPHASVDVAAGYWRTIEELDAEACFRVAFLQQGRCFSGRQGSVSSGLYGVSTGMGGL